jgi:hypothetical protein
MNFFKISVFSFWGQIVHIIYNCWNKWLFGRAHTLYPLYVEIIFLSISRIKKDPFFWSTFVKLNCLLTCTKNHWDNQQFSSWTRSHSPHIRGTWSNHHKPGSDPRRGARMILIGHSGWSFLALAPSWSVADLGRISFWWFPRVHSPRTKARSNFVAESKFFGKIFL